MTAAADQARRSATASRTWHGAPVFSRGFRRFFLAAGACALIGMALWVPVFTDAITIPTAFSAGDLSVAIVRLTSPGTNTSWR